MKGMRVLSHNWLVFIIAVFAIGCGDDGSDSGNGDGPGPDAGTTDLGQVDMGPPDLGTQAPAVATLVGRLSGFTRSGDVSALPEQFRDRSPFEDEDIRFDMLDPFNEGGLRLVVLPPFARTGGQWEGPSPGPGGGSMTLMPNRMVEYSPQGVSANLVFESFTFSQASDPDGPGWNPGMTGTLVGQEEYSGDVSIPVEATINFIPDTAAPTSFLSPPGRGFLLPWESVRLSFSEPVDGSALGFTVNGSTVATAVSVDTSQLTFPTLEGGVVSADVDLNGNLWPEGEVTIEYLGGDLDAAGNPARTTMRVYEQVPRPGPANGIDFEDAAADPGAWGEDEPIPDGLCLGDRCKALVVTTAGVGIYFRITSAFGLGSISFEARYLAESCGDNGTSTTPRATVHEIGSLPSGVAPTIQSVRAERTDTPPPGYACDSGWTTRTISFGGGSDVGVALQFAKPRQATGKRVILIDNITQGS